MIDDPQTLLRHEIRQATRLRFHQTMGELRSMAASMAAKGLLGDEDEDTYFQGLVAEHYHVVRQELSKLLGLETAQKLLDLFGNHENRTN
jgi:hypothetical protein